MNKKAKKKLEAELLAIANKKYTDEIIKVEVLDKHNCEITIEIEYAKSYKTVSMPIAQLI